MMEIYTYQWIKESFTMNLSLDFIISTGLATIVDVVLKFFIFQFSLKILFFYYNLNYLF